LSFFFKQNHDPPHTLSFPGNSSLNGRFQLFLWLEWNFLLVIDGLREFHRKKMAQGDPNGHGGKHLCLSNMASMIINILKETEITTFPDMAEKVIVAMGPDDSNGNNGRTLRRRVYDVLNVFLAVGFIAKENKQITYQQPAAIRAPLGNADEIQERVRCKELGLTDNIKMFIAWRCLIERNRTRARPETAVPVHKTLFIGFKHCSGGYERLFDGRSLSIRANSPPEFFSPMNVLDKMEIPRYAQFSIMKQYPELQPMLSVMFPDIA
jgi:hypothetical protein